MSDLNRILRAVRPSGDTSYAPSRADYEEALRQAEILSASETIVDKRDQELSDLALEIFRDWQRRPQVACVFARLIAKNPSAYDVQWEVLTARAEPETARQIATRVRKLTDDVIREKEAIAIVIPRLTSAAALASFCKSLGTEPGWQIQATLNPSDKLSRVYVRLLLLLSPDVEAEVLGLGPFDFLPPTRRAPITALQIRTKAVGAKERGRRSRKKAHLAEIQWPPSQSKRYDDFWKATAQQRVAILGGDDSAARARVTFAIPADIWGVNGHTS